MAEKLCGGSLVPILSHLARSKSLSAKERRALRELIDRPDEARPQEPRPEEGRPDDRRPNKGGQRKG